MNKTFNNKMKKALLSQKKDILQKSGQTIDIDVDGDETDEIQGNMILNILKHLSSRDSYKLSQIETALLKIENKTYGSCEDCLEEIPQPRLTFDPCFLTCVDCAADREKR